MTDRILVWDRFIRFFHWSTASLFLLNYGIVEDGGDLHDWIGYVVGVLVLLRIVWGVVGSPFARFTNFFPTPKKIKAHLDSLWNREPEESLGHNPLGGLMILLLLALLLGLTVTGWMMNLDAYWGEDWVEELHKFCANFVMSLVLVHIGAVILLSRWQRQSLVKAMITGYKNVLAKPQTDCD